MMLKAVIFLAVVLTALALIPYGAHLFSLPNKIGMTREQYFVAQSVYDGWALLERHSHSGDAGECRAGADAARRGGRSGLAMAGCVCMAATLAVFFTFTYPANVATQNWKVAPSDWAALRHQLGIFARGERRPDLRLVLPDRARQHDRACAAALMPTASSCSTCVLVPGPSPVISTTTSSSLAPS